MKQLREIVGYVLGDVVACGVMLCGLLLSIWTIVYMKLRGKGNPMDAFGHEVAPRTQNLMTDGPYRLNRNPMLTGTLIYLAGFAIWLWSWQALIIWILATNMMPIAVTLAGFRVKSEE